MTVALQLAVAHNDESIARIFIETSDPKDLNEKTCPLGRTLLHLAVRNDNHRISRLLLEHGADVNELTNDNLTSLHIAIANRSKAMVELLFEFGANPNPIKKFNGKTPLFMAVEYDCPEITEILLMNGASIEDATIASTSVLHVAMRIGSEKLAKVLLEYATENIVGLRNNLDEKTALHLAIEAGQYEIVRLLLKCGANANDPCYIKINGYEEIGNPLSLAIRRGDEKMAALLLRNGASDSSCNDCLHQAVRLRCKKMVNLLLSTKASDVNSLNSDGLTALQVAMNNGYKDIVKICLKHGASLDKLDTKNVPILYEPVKTGDQEMVELLIKNGAPVNKFIRKNIRILDVAIKSRSVGITKLLLRHGAIINENATEEEQAFALKYAVLLLSQGCKIKKENRKLIRNNPNWGKYYESCRKEIKEAKDEKIGQCNICFYDLLSKNDDALAAYARNEEFIKEFPETNYKTKYPIYADTLALNYTKGRLRNILLQKAVEEFEKEFGLHGDCAHNVFRLMTNEDLRNFIRSVCKCDSLNGHECLPELLVVL